MVNIESSPNRMQFPKKTAAALVAASALSFAGCSASTSPVVPEHIVHVEPTDDDGTRLRPGEAAIRTVCFEAFRQADEELNLRETDAREDLAVACREAAQTAIEFDDRGNPENLVDEDIEVDVTINSDDRPEVEVRQVNS